MGQTHAIDEHKGRKRELATGHSLAIGESESKLLYMSDARPARNPQEIVAGRDIEGVTLTYISPNAAWKEAVFRFRV